MIKKQTKAIHFIGIGGIGMSSLALFLHSEGHTISGSDVGEDPVIKKLKILGCSIMGKHSSKNVESQDLVIYSSAIQMNNPEIVKAKKNKIRILKRGEALGFFTKKMKNITVTGCHGKSTTTSISRLLIENSGISLTSFIGAEDKILKSNFQKGTSNLCLIEGDESDNSFNHINSSISIVTNIDNDHLDFYGSEKKILMAFKQFIINTKNKCIVNNDSPMLRQVLKKVSSKKIIKFGKGIDPSNKYTFKILRTKNVAVELYRNEKKIGVFSSKLYGEFNAYNLVASIILSLELKIDLEEIQKSTRECRAPKRRFETIMNNKNIRIIDDYAHHPTAIKAIRENMAKNFKDSPIILVFQPHRFSRTAILLKEFVAELSAWEAVYLVDTYSAFENKNRKEESLYDEIKRYNRNIVFFKSNESLINKLISKIRYKKHTILTMGAGDIRDVGIKLKKRF